MVYEFKSKIVQPNLESAEMKVAIILIRNSMNRSARL